MQHSLFRIPIIFHIFLLFSLPSPTIGASNIYEELPFRLKPRKRFQDFYLQARMPLDFAILLDQHKILRHSAISSFVEENEFGYVFEIITPTAKGADITATAYLLILNNNNVVNSRDDSKQMTMRLTRQKRSESDILVNIFDSYRINISYNKSLISIIVTITESVAQNCWKQFTSLDNFSLLNFEKLLNQKTKPVREVLDAKNFIKNLLNIFNFLFPPKDDVIKILKPWGLSNLVVVKLLVNTDRNEQEFLDEANEQHIRNLEKVVSQKDLLLMPAAGRREVVGESTNSGRFQFFSITNDLQYQIYKREIWQIKMININIEKSLLSSSDEKFDVSIIRTLQEQKMYFLTVCKWIFNMNTNLFGKNDWGDFQENIRAMWRDFYVNRLNQKDDLAALHKPKMQPTTRKVTPKKSAK